MKPQPKQEQTHEPRSREAHVFIRFPFFVASRAPSKIGCTKEGPHLPSLPQAGDGKTENLCMENALAQSAGRRAGLRAISFSVGKRKLIHHFVASRANFEHIMKR